MEKGDGISFRDVIKARKTFIGRSCCLHYEAAPLKVERATKQYMYDDVGEQYLDCINSHSHVGHCHPHVVRAGQNQMGRLVTCGGFLNDAQVRYAERLAETLPEKLSVCFFVNSGSEANDLAVRLARGVTKRKGVLVVEGSYNGAVAEMKELSPLRHRSREEWVHLIPLPDMYRGKYARADKPVELFIDDYRKYLDANGTEIAALLHEPMSVAGGVHLPGSRYMQHLYKAVREKGGLVIANEMLTGLGRTGKHWWSFEAFDVVPDIMTCAKPLGNGFPLGVVMTSRRIADTSGDLLTSFGGNPLACSVGLAVLDVIENERLRQSALQVGNILLSGFNKLREKHTFIGDVRGLGFVIGVEIVESQHSRVPSRLIAEHLVYKFKDAHILTFNGGPEKNVLVFTPPMCFTCENAWHLLATADKLLTDFEAGRKEMECDSDTKAEGPLISLEDLCHYGNRKRVYSLISSDSGSKCSCSYNDVD